MDSIIDLGSFAVIILIANMLTEWLANIMPKGKARKILVFVPFLLAIAASALLQLATDGDITAPAFARAFVAGTVTVLSHNIQKAGEKTAPESSGGSGELSTAS